LKFNFYLCPPIGIIGASFCSPGLNVKISPAGIFLFKKKKNYKTSKNEILYLLNAFHKQEYDQMLNVY
jgi:aminopeptidase-like protein